jgi:hypothetical protein
MYQDNRNKLFQNEIQYVHQLITPLVNLLEILQQFRQKTQAGDFLSYFLDFLFMFILYKMIIILK